MRHIERHRTHRVGWLRAAVLGANDGIVSTGERGELASDRQHEHAEMAAIYMRLPRV